MKIVQKSVASPFTVLITDSNGKTTVMNITKQRYSIKNLQKNIQIL